MSNLNLEDNAVSTFYTVMDDNNDRLLTPAEAAEGINNYILWPISRTFVGIQEGSRLIPENLDNFLNDNGTIGEPELKALLEQYLEFLANKTNNPRDNLRSFIVGFNNQYMVPQQANVEPTVIPMVIVEEDFDNPQVNEDVLNYDFDEEDQLAQAIALSLDGAPRNQRTLSQLNEIIQVFNPLLPGDESASEFLDGQDDYNPFIIRTQNGLFSGDAIDWPAVSSSGKEFIECKDNAPAVWQGNTYRRWIKNNARKFIKINLSGSPTLVIKPDWYDRGSVPGTKYFKLVSAGNVTKFMSKVLSSQNLPADFSALGADHCNQNGSIGVYVLQEITLDELNGMIPLGGSQNRKNKSKKHLKIKNKYHKFTKKGLKKLKIIRKTNKKSKKFKKTKRLRYKK